MNKKKTISLTQARKTIFDLAEEVQHNTVYTLTEHGKPKAVLLSAEAFQSLEKTAEIITETNVPRQLAQAEKKRVYSAYKELEEVLAAQGFVVADNTKRKYEAKANISHKKRRKRS